MYYYLGLPRSVGVDPDLDPDHIRMWVHYFFAVATHGSIATTHKLSYCGEFIGAPFDLEHEVEVLIL